MNKYQEKLNDDFNSDQMKNKKLSRIEAENLEAFKKYKEAFDSFDWNKTKTIATSVSFNQSFNFLVLEIQAGSLYQTRTIMQ